MIDTQTKSGCRRKLASGQWFAFCGETDMGQTEPALCVGCGGDMRLADASPLTHTPNNNTPTITDAELIDKLRERPYDRAAQQAADRLEELTSAYR